MTVYLCLQRDQPPPTPDGFQSKLVKEVLSGHVQRAGRDSPAAAAGDGCDYQPVAVMTFDAELVTFSQPTVLLPSARHKNIKMRKTKVFSALHC